MTSADTPDARPAAWSVKVVASGPPRTPEQCDRLKAFHLLAAYPDNLLKLILEHLEDEWADEEILDRARRAGDGRHG